MHKKPGIQINWKEVGKRIADLRGNATQLDFARTMHFPPGTKEKNMQSVISNYESGETPAPPELLLFLAEKFQKTVDWFLTGEEDIASERGKLSDVEKQIVNWYHGMHEEDQNSWKRMGMVYYEKRVSDEAAQRISRSADKITKKRSKETSKN